MIGAPAGQLILTVGLQAIINLADVTGVGPTKGIALHMLSSGGTGWILTAASLGLLVAIDRTQSLSPLAASDSAGASADDPNSSPAPIVVTPAARTWPATSRRAS